METPESSAPPDVTGESRSPLGSLPFVVLWVLLALELGAALLLCDGRLMYTLDDPYIHLALAENLIGGHFGLNPGEASAPSSSILWPFLLAPFTGLGWGEWVPLLFNVLFASATLWLVQRTIHEVLEPEGDERLRAAVVVLSIFSIPALNLVGLVFTGMEHSLQVLFAVLLLRELLAAVRGQPRRAWLLVAIVVGPLVRYENTALSAAGLLWLWWNGEWGRTTLAATLVAVGVGAYSLWLLSLGLYPLPSSVLAKAAAADPGGLKPVLYGLYHNLSSTPGLLMSLMVVALVAAATSRLRKAREQRLALALAVSLFLHLLVGRFGWYGRYEVYAWGFGLLGSLFLWRAGMRAWLARQSTLRTVLIALFVVGFACREYVIVLANNALAAQNVYRQHYQMHRIVTEVIGEPVAVNDLGWVAFRNDEYVLDLWGLASIQALEARRGKAGSDWIVPLAEEHGVRSALLYEDWFPDLPREWRRVGELRMAGPRVTPAKDVVAIFAFDAEKEAELRQALDTFRATLPDGATLVLEGETRP